MTRRAFVWVLRLLLICVLRLEGGSRARWGRKGRISRGDAHVDSVASRGLVGRFCVLVLGVFACAREGVVQELGRMGGAAVVVVVGGGRRIHP